MLNTMRWTPRVIGGTAALLGVACVAIAGLEPTAEQIPEQRPHEPERKESGQHADQQPQDASAGDARSDARADAGDAGKLPGCKNVGDRGCRAHADCCSGKCREDGMCVDECQEPPPANGTCPIDGTPDCCIGFWCGGGSVVAAKCTPCVRPGQPVGRDQLGSPTRRSCCSKQEVNGICQ
jgi:hypothetical protein